MAIPTVNPEVPSPPDRTRGPWRGPLLALPLALALVFLHGAATWHGLGGAPGISGPWPIARHDHPLYFHSALVTRSFLAQTGTTAGYDPSFMAGYPKSVIFPASSTLPELVIALFGGARPVLAYKFYVLIAVASAPWLIGLAAWLWGARWNATAGAILLWLIYVWTDFPIQYATFGMVPYFLAVPLGLVALAVLTGYLDRGGLGRWLLAASACVVVVLVHFTVAMVLAPAAALAYAAAWRRGTCSSRSRHLGVWLVPFLVVVLNAFWWWPGPWLAGTKGASDFAFTHSTEGVLPRLAKIMTVEPPIQPLLWVLGAAGLVLLIRRDRTAGLGAAGFLALGLFWGYGAAASERLDFLQPGRHTYAFYSAAAILGGMAVAALLNRPARRWARVALTLVVITGLAVGFGPQLGRSLAIALANPFPALTRLLDPRLDSQLRRARLDPFLSSRPRPLWSWVVETAQTHLKPGDRVLYEEVGFALPDERDPFHDGRLSGLLPYFVPGVEVLGGPYLHAALTTNFTQFGEGKLFGRAGWGRDHFIRYARLYRPTAIVCWSAHAVRFCRDHPDLIEIIAERSGVLFGRVKGFEGDTIEGSATVQARPGRLIVTPTPSEIDDPIVLRYHFAPYLRTRPPTEIVPIQLEDDPVPFLGLRGGTGTIAIELRVPPG